MYALSFFTV